MGKQERDTRVSVWSGEEQWSILNGRGQVDVISAPSTTVNPNINSTYVSLSRSTAGREQIIAATASKSIQLRYVHVNNGGASTVTAAFRQGSAGSNFFIAQLAGSGGQWNANLIATYRQLTANTSLFVTLSGAIKVNFEVGYKLL